MGHLLVLFLLAEAGYPSFDLCRDASCPCDGQMCGCGQVCKFAGQATRACVASTARFCSTNADCALSCGSFVCEFNQCITGTLPDGGANAPMPAPALMPVAPIESTLPAHRQPSCGGAGFGIVALLQWVRRLTIRRS